MINLSFQKNVERQGSHKSLTSQSETNTPRFLEDEKTRRERPASVLPTAGGAEIIGRKRRSAGRFSGGVCCASFSRSRIDWRRNLRGDMVVVWWGTPQKTMEDPDTIDSEVEPPQKTGLRGLVRLLQGLGAYRKCLFVPISGLCVLSLFELPSAGNEAAIARWKSNRARTEKDHRA
ncbi:hypothetical protein BHYA_0029g00320 [Botrytis hyacinthi]|uniref:Uncharacterized protein n=1 Tax=Botrytis hyacinthi TaxID=278943 RepID=A0A4Z1GZW9_9HELO|nr:hypothetical protein BHYA_0029g00320 [Botrytis hyacinthi]